MSLTRPKRRSAKLSPLVTDVDEQKSGSLITLISAVVTLVPRLIRDEVQTLRLEITGKLKAAGLGIGLLVGGSVVGFFALGTLVAAALAGLSVALPMWLAALIVAAVLLVITAALGLLGLRHFTRGKNRGES
jgi:hypothetical protein